MDIREYLSGKNIQWTEHQRPSGLNANFICPSCGNKDKSFAINLTTGAYKCPHENSCGIRGSWYDFQRLFNDTPVPLNSDNIISKIPKVKKYNKPKLTINNNINDAAMKFLIEERAFNPLVLDKFKLGITPDGKAIMFPYYKEGVLVNVKYRSIEEKKFWQEKNPEPILYNRDNIPVDARILVICEGEMDCIALKHYNIDAVSIPSGVNNMDWIENEWEWIDRFRMIYICMDMDEAGNDAVNVMIKRLGSWRCKRVELPFKDANECLLNWVDVSTIDECFENAKEFSPILLVNSSKFYDEVLDLFANPTKTNGTQTQFRGLNYILGGWRSSELTVWSGNNGSGKSTMLNQIMIDLLSQRIPCCIASLEIPAARYLRWAVMQYLEKEKPNPEEIKQAMDFFQKNLYIINTHEQVEIDVLMDSFIYAARRYGCKHFIVDSLMRFKINPKDELNEQKNITSRLISFAQAYNVHVHLVAHPRKGINDKDVPDKVDVAGAGDITNLAHNVLIMWRPSEELKEEMIKKQKDASDGILFIKKNRELGTEGKVKFIFNQNIKKFSEI
jgi:twinkle protein